MKKNPISLFIGLSISMLSFGQVGIGTTTPNSMLDVRGSFATNYRAVTGTTSITATDNTVVFTGTSNSTLTLPSAIGVAGRVYWIKNASTALVTPTLTIATSLSQTIDGNSNWSLDEPNEIIRLISDGSNWYVLNQDVAVPKTSTTGGAWLQGGNRVSSEKYFGTTTNFNLPFITNNIERMRLTTAGFLGLGTTSPSGRFHSVSEALETANDYIFDDYGAGTSQGFYLTKSRGTVASPSDLAINDQIGWIRFIPRYNGTLSTSAGYSSMEAYYRGNGTTNLTDFRLFTSGTERMRLSETGNVGIGTATFDATNPEKLLVDAGTTGSFNVISGRGNINNYLQLNIQNRSAGTSASSDVVATANNGNESTNYIDMGVNSSGYSNTGLPILDGVNTTYLYATGRNFFIGNGSSGRDLVFFTNGFAASDEKMRILSGGNVGIGTSTPSDKLTVAGVVAPTTDNSFTLGKNTLRWSAVWAANGTIQTSDMRLKKDIAPLQYGLKEILQLQPVSYQWTQNENGNKIGLIAQQVKQIVPEVVIGDEEKELLGMNYAELVPVLINAVKEQQQQIDAVEKKIEKIEQQKKNRKRN